MKLRQVNIKKDIAGNNAFSWGWQKTAFILRQPLTITLFSFEQTVIIITIICYQFINFNSINNWLTFIWHGFRLQASIIGWLVMWKTKLKRAVTE